MMTDQATRAPEPGTRKSSLAHRLYTGEISYDFVSRRNRWYVISGVILLISILAIAFRGLNLGIEFRGGVEFLAPIQVTSSTVEDVRRSVQDLGIAGNDDITVNTIGDNQVRVQTTALDPEEVTEVKGAIAGVAGVQPDDVAYSAIGASWGQQITVQAVIALVVFLVLVMLLIWIYFREFKMSIAAIVALAHDLLVTVGIYALVGFTVTPATMIGVLTILGYSLYDTMVVFDRIRDNTREIENSRNTYSQAANTALNQVLVRSLNTTIIGVLPVAALLVTGWFILGTGPLKDLGLALFVGMVAGAYSSIYIATPLLAQMREADPDMTEHRQRLARRAARVTEKVAHRARAVTVAVGDSAAAEVDPSTLGLVSAKELQQPGSRRQPAKHTRSQRRK